MPSILLAQADPEPRLALAAALDADGHQVREATTAQHTAVQLKGHHADLLLLATTDPGLGLLRDLRDGRLDLTVSPGLPVITIGPDSDVDTIRALDAGADFHLPGNTNPLLLRAAITALVRRTAGGHSPRQLVTGPLSIDAVTRTAAISGEVLELTNREFELLRRLATDPARVFTKNDLLRDLWGWQSGRTRTLDSHAYRLRRKLADHGQSMVINHWGLGYALITPDKR